MDSLLGADSGIPLGPIRLLGIEIVFRRERDGRGRIWIPIHASNHLVYGKNGVGKSTIVDLIKCALTGVAPRSGTEVNLFVDIDVTIPLPGGDRTFHFEYVDDEEVENDHDVDDSPETEGDTDDPETDDLIDDDDATLDLDLHDPEAVFTWTMSGLESYLVEAISNSTFFGEFCPANNMDYLDFTRVQETITGPDHKLTLGQFVARRWEDDSGVTLQMARNAWLTYCHLTDTKSDYEYEGDELERIGAAYGEASSQRIYCLTPVGAHGKSQWEFVVACKITPDTPRLAWLDEYIDTCRRHEAQMTGDQSDSPEDLNEWITDSDFLHRALPSQAFTNWENSVSQFLGERPAHPYRKLRPWTELHPILEPREVKWHKLITVLDLSEPFVYPTWRLDRAKELFPRYARGTPWTALFSGNGTGVGQGATRSTGEIESDVLTGLRERMESVSSTIRIMDVNLSGVRVNHSPHLSDWIDGTGLSIEAQDSTSSTWVDFSLLSSSQQHVISSVLRIVEALPSPDETLPILVMLADEPDRNMHQSAIRRYYRCVEDMVTWSYIATHSPVALSIPHFSRLHAFRHISGELGVSPLIPAAIDRDEAEKLGVDHIELLSTVNVLLLVEGSHDEVALLELLRPFDSVSMSRVLVVPWRGHRNMHTIADSFVWMSLTDAHIVVVTDNARAETLSKIRDEALQEAREGTRPNQIVRRIERQLSSADISPEEKTLYDLVERALHVGSLNRVHPFGLAHRDIIEYADPADFGLTKSWDILRSQYARSSERLPFKDWLRTTHDARISNETVRVAFSNLDHLETDIVDLLGLIDRLV